MPNTRNQSNFSTPHWLYIYIYIWEHGWILVLLLISLDWFKHSNSSVSGYKCILNWFGCIIWRPKAIFCKNCNGNNRWYSKFNPYIFHTSFSFEFSIYRVFIVSNHLKCIHAIIIITIWLIIIIIIIIIIIDVILLLFHYFNWYCAVYGVCHRQDT